MGRGFSREKLLAEKGLSNVTGFSNMGVGLEIFLLIILNTYVQDTTYLLTVTKLVYCLNKGRSLQMKSMSPFHQCRKILDIGGPIPSHCSRAYKFSVKSMPPTRAKGNFCEQIRVHKIMDFVHFSQ